MVPYAFTAQEIEKTRQFLIDHVRKNSYIRNGTVKGNPLVPYKDVASFLGYSIDDQFDGDRMGIVVGRASEENLPASGVLISAIVVSVEHGRPGTGFYNCARENGIFNSTKKKFNPDGTEEIAFWNDQLTKVVAKYGKRGKS
jgi:hypothetical protein